MRGKKVFVTGGSGFIGSNLCRRLIQMGAKVYVAVKYDSVIDNVRLNGLWNQLTPVEIDLRNTDALTQVKQIKPDIIYHLAAYNHVGDSFLQINEAIECNSRASVNLLEAYQDYERFVYISSSEVYGYQETVPWHEEMPVRPISPYSAGKYMGELYARMKFFSTKKPIVVLRPFNAFGPYQSPRAVTAELIIKCLLGQDIVTTPGKQTREFNFVENLIDGFILAATKKEALGEIINLGCGVEVTICDLANKIHTLTKSKSKLRIGDLHERPVEIWRMCASNEKAKKLLDWTPKVDLESGLLKSIDWYKKYVSVYEDPKSALSKLGLTP